MQERNDLLKRSPHKGRKRHVTDRIFQFASRGYVDDELDQIAKMFRQEGRFLNSRCLETEALHCVDLASLPS